MKITYTHIQRLPLRNVIYLLSGQSRMVALDPYRILAY